MNTRYFDQQDVLASKMRRYSILIVDDELYVRRTLSRLFRNEGSICKEAADADEALEYLKTSIPDVVLTDIKMPGMDGIELCRKIKSSPETKMVGVIMLTSAGDRPSIMESLKAGADDYVLKPYDLQILKQKIEEVLVKLGRMHAAPGSGQPVDAAPPEVSAPRDTQPQGRDAARVTALKKSRGTGLAARLAREDPDESEEAPGGDGNG